MGFKHTIAMLLLLATTFNQVMAAQQVIDKQQLIGSYQGELKVQGQQFPLVFHFNVDAQQKITATLDSPAQGALGIPVQQVDIQQQQVTLNVKVAGAVYTGHISADYAKLSGVWKQGLNSFALNFRRQTQQVNSNTQQPQRPQNPKAPYNYTVEEVKVFNSLANITLAGTLTLPKRQATQAAVVLITGSGPQDRDQTFMGHKTFWVLADHLSSQGIAVLRLDDRGVGQSQGNFNQANSLDFAHDISAAVNFLASKATLSNKPIGLIGHSEGGLIAPITQSLNQKVAFIVMLAGPGQTGNDIAVAQTQSFLQANGVSESTAIAGSNITRALNQTVLANTNKTNLASELKLGFKQAWQATPAQAKQELQALGGGQLSEARIQQLSSVWTRYFLAHNPADYLANISIPVMAIHGDKDTQMHADKNLSLVQQALAAKAHKLNRIEKLSGLNHLFQQAQTGAMNEYAKISQTIAPQVLQLVSSWINTVAAER